MVLSGLAKTTLWDRRGGLIYDDVMKITWLQNANCAKTSDYSAIPPDVNGRMTWSQATTWAANLSYYDSLRGVYWDDWRLPKTVDGLFVWGYNGTTTGAYNITTVWSRIWQIKPGTQIVRRQCILEE